jgi:hypothetical protein
MKEITKISEALFEKLRAKFKPVTLGDEKSQKTADPSQARFFNFQYTDEAGNKLGAVTCSLIDEQSLKVFYSKSIAEKLVGEEQNNWYSFLKGIKDFAIRNMLTFDARDLDTDSLELRDLQTASNSGIDKTDLNVTESKKFGTTRSSYENVGPAKIIVRHTEAINPDQRGARSRKIESVFVETMRGERFLMDFKNLHGARAMAVHLSEGGNIADDRAQHISQLVKEMADMSHFVRTMRSRTFEDLETSDMVHAAVKHFYDTKSKLKSMRSPHGYRNYYETWQDIPANSSEEANVEALRDRFVKKIFDDRLEAALPHVYRAYNAHKAQVKTKYLDEFDQWLEEQDQVEETEIEEADFPAIDEMSDLAEEPVSEQVELSLIRQLAGLVK